MQLNDDVVHIKSGDVCLTRSGESHALINTGEQDMHWS